MMVDEAAGLALPVHGVLLECHASAIDVLVGAGYDPPLGARPMRRAVSRLLEAPLARTVLTGRAGRGERISGVAGASRLLEGGRADLCRGGNEGACALGDFPRTEAREMAGIANRSTAGA